MPPESADLLIAARWVLPIAPANTVLTDHSVVVTDGRIVAVGPTDLMSASFAPAERVERSHHVLLPGFVNAHTRAAMTVFRGLPVQGPRMRWLREIVEPIEQRCIGPDMVRDGTLLAMAEMLKVGITAFADMYSFPEEVARAAATARMRAAVGLPVGDVPSAWADSPTAYLAEAERLWDSYQSDPWVCLYFAPHAAHEISDDTLVRVRRVADELDARIAMPAQESELMLQDSLSQHGRRPLQRLDHLGLLRPGFAAIHMNRLDEADLELVARTGIQVIACPQSNLRLGSGFCPVQRLDSQHVTVGLGTADPVSAGAFDLLAEARTAALVANGTNNGSGWLASHDVLRMATLGGAGALGLGGLLGSIEPGKAADLACFELGQCDSEAQIADALVFGVRQQASDVWTSGRPAVSEGQLLTFDEQELCAIARQWAQRTRIGEQP